MMAPSWKMQPWRRLTITASFLVILASLQLTAAGNNYYYNNVDDNNNNQGNKYKYNYNYNYKYSYNNNGNYNNNNNKNNNNAGNDDGNDDQSSSGNDDKNNAANNDDASGNNQNANSQQTGDDYYGLVDDVYSYEQSQYQDKEDDTFHWNSHVGFGGVSIMPISCINYNNGHMIKFQLFDSANSYQCHFSEISTFVVSIAHYMRSYFNYQALVLGKDFTLPEDAAYLNCLQLENASIGNSPLYAKIGCMERETFTSTKLQLHLYKDEQCSQPYDDGQSARKRANRGFLVGDKLLPTKVSFRPPFYKCLTCAPEQVSATFNKKNGNWYDDDYISAHGNGDGDDDAAEAEAEDDYYHDDYFDDKYLSANDDVSKNDDKQNNANDDKYNKNNNNYYNKNNNGYNNYYNKNGYNNGYNGYNYNNGNNNNGYNRYNGYNYNYGYNRYSNDDDYNRRVLTASNDDLQAYQHDFWSEIERIQASRSLYDNYYDIGDWNMCQRLYKYGMWCDSECRALDFFRTNQWSASDVFLLAIMCTFLTAMMLLIVAKRLKARQKIMLYGEGNPLPGLPPFAMAIIFSVIMAVIITLAKMKFINETLVFAVVTCILLFIYMLKLTLFERKRPVLLATPRHDAFDNPLDDRFM